MYAERVRLYKDIEEMRNSKVIAYITGDRPGMETQIHPEAVDMIAELLDVAFNKSKKISLFLYSRGGVTLAGWNIVNLIRMFCDEFEVIIPSKALSTATLISIGADEIIMTKQATLGPIDPSINGPYNPTGPFGGTHPVSVEDVAGFFNLARKEVGKDASMAPFFQQLAEKVHPLALGSVSRARDQIKMLAEKLLQPRISDKSKRDRVIAFLCSESGSHDYTINRREAEALGLPVKKPDENLYKKIQEIYVDIRDNLKLREPFNAQRLFGHSSEPVPYTATNGLIESVDGGSYQFQSVGIIQNMAQNLPQIAGQPVMSMPSVIDNRQQEGWVYVPPAK